MHQENIKFDWESIAWESLSICIDASEYELRTFQIWSDGTRNPYFYLNIEELKKSGIDFAAREVGEIALLGMRTTRRKLFKEPRLKREALEGIKNAEHE